eukprot:3683656-Rhodomonas_salina.5
MLLPGHSEEHQGRGGQGIRHVRSGMVLRSDAVTGHVGYAPTRRRRRSRAPWPRSSATKVYPPILGPTLGPTPPSLLPCALPYAVSATDIRLRYAKSGTEIGDAATRLPLTLPGLRSGGTLSYAPTPLLRDVQYYSLCSYASAMRCPVLRLAFLCHTSPVCDVRLSYAKSGTEIGYGPGGPRRALGGTDAHGQGSAEIKCDLPPAPRDVRYGHSVRCYAIPGADLSDGPMRSAVLT